MNNLYFDYLKELRLKQLARRQPIAPKGELCPQCGSVRQFHHVNCNWVRPDADIILNNYYRVKVCPACGHHIYPDEMMKEYLDLRKQKVLV